MSIQIFDKDPSAILDYTIDWSAWLASGDTVSASAFTVPTGITKTTQSNSTTASTVWVSGGTAGTIYRVMCQITTANGRTDQRSIDINVIDK